MIYGFFFVFFLMVVGEIGPLLIELAGYLIWYFLLVNFIALKFVIKGLLWVLIRVGKILLRIAAFVVRSIIRAFILAGRGIHFSALLLYFLIDEKLRGAPDDPCSEEPDDDEYEPSFDDEEDEAAAQSDLEAACALFGLALTLTREELQRAYKSAIRKAHPDLGGSVEQAQELNIARDLIMSTHGWAR